MQACGLKSLKVWTREVAFGCGLMAWQWHIIISVTVRPVAIMSRHPKRRRRNSFIRRNVHSITIPITSEMPILILIVLHMLVFATALRFSFVFRLHFKLDKLCLFAHLCYCLYHFWCLCNSPHCNHSFFPLYVDTLHSYTSIKLENEWTDRHTWIQIHTHIMCDTYHWFALVSSALSENMTYNSGDSLSEHKSVIFNYKRPALIYINQIILCVVVGCAAFTGPREPWLFIVWMTKWWCSEALRVSLCKQCLKPFQIPLTCPSQAPTMETKYN